MKPRILPFVRYRVFLSKKLFIQTCLVFNCLTSVKLDPGKLKSVLQTVTDRKRPSDLLIEVGMKGKFQNILSENLCPVVFMLSPRRIDCFSH